MAAKEKDVLLPTEVGMRFPVKRGSYEASLMASRMAAADF